ncbi:hypothetical protein ABT352_32745 [Streptosporangium sp. NPDC000563]|uniref:hypothetical protein n=1 Tax=Streptosporangium sp. NPDC000563 TaxID=3154366 RepID=UPI00332C8912
MGDVWLPVRDAARDDMLASFVAMPAEARMRLLDEQPDVYWRALDLYVEHLTGQLTECAKAHRADRRSQRLGAGLSRLGGVFTRTR